MTRKLTPRELEEERERVAQNRSKLSSAERQALEADLASAALSARRLEQMGGHASYRDTGNGESGIPR